MMVGMAGVVGGAIVAGVASYIKNPILMVIALIFFGFGLWMLYRQAT